MDHDRLVRVYLKMRQKRKELKKEYEDKDAEIAGGMTTIENLLLKSLIDNKVDSMGATPGTFYKEEIIKPSCNDWEAYRRWMIENDALDGVEKRVTKSFIASYMEDNDNELPPGISVIREQVVRVRTSNK